MPEESKGRRFAKHMASAAVGIVAGRLVASAVDNYTRFGKDDIVVQLGAGAVAWHVVDRVEPYTDAIVDKSFDYVAEKRAQRKAKKKDTDK